MFGFVDKSSGLLFSSHDLSERLRGTAQGLSKEVEGLDANRLLNTAPDDLKDYLVEKYSVTPATLLRDQWYADTTEIQVDVRYDQRRLIRDTGRPVLIPGERVEVHVPFEGEAELFYARPNAMSSNPPRALIEKNELVMRFDSPADQPQDIRPAVDLSLIHI